MSGVSGNVSALDAIRMNYNTIFGLLVTWNNDVYKLIDTARPIGIKNVETNIPKIFCLSQNYPNPFNPSTKIKYDIPKTSQVTIKVFDLIGREVTTLVNEIKQPGSYEAEFNASNFASGVYFYRIEAGNYVNVKKMVLVK